MTFSRDSKGMSDKITKALARLTPKERKLFKNILEDIQAGNLGSYDIKRLAGRDDIFRLRKGTYRIIFRMKDTMIMILSLERRSDTTYR